MPATHHKQDLSVANRSPLWLMNYSPIQMLRNQAILCSPTLMMTSSKCAVFESHCNQIIFKPGSFFKLRGERKNTSFTSKFESSVGRESSPLEHSSHTLACRKLSYSLYRRGSGDLLTTFWVRKDSVNLRFGESWSSWTLLGWMVC